MLVFFSFSGNSLVYLIVWFRQKLPLVSVIVVVGLANLSCCCDHCVNVANKPETKNVRQRTPPPELILFWSHVTSVFQGLSLSRSVGENPGNEVDAFLVADLKIICISTGSLRIKRFGLTAEYPATYLNMNSSYCYIPRASKHTDTCK